MCLAYAGKLLEDTSSLILWPLRNSIAVGPTSTRNWQISSDFTSDGVSSESL